MSGSSRPPRIPARAGTRTATAASDEAFVSALAPAAGGRLQHTLPPAVHPAPGALDATTVAGVVLVAYSAGGGVVVARGSDLAAIRLLEHPAATVCSAIAFRPTDGALAAAFEDCVVVYEGWCDAAALRGLVYDTRYVIAELQFPGANVSALAWTADGSKLSAVGDGVVVWACEPTAAGFAASQPGLHAATPAEVFVPVVELYPDSENMPVARLDISAISPDGSFLCAAALHARTGWVWNICAIAVAVPVPVPVESATASEAASAMVSTTFSMDEIVADTVEGISSNSASTDFERPELSMQSRSRTCAELVFGYSGVASMGWKPRGGGKSALMTVDADGSLRIWARVAPAKLAEASSDADTLSWMEEIARCPHVDRTARAGAAFVHWGGGGGAADDESDAAATAAAHPFIADGAAPKPSRALHWIVRVAGGDARAWRVRGLDDQPRPEFARLEPGSGFIPTDGGAVRDTYNSDVANASGDETGVGSSEDASSPASLDGATVAATRAIAPVPLTTSSSERVGLVKSYAISNGERRLRSPAPPEPPNIAAVFVLIVRNGAAFVARYDMSPTSRAPAVCRARVGAGHTTPVWVLQTMPARFAPSITSASSSATWLLSQGTGGDALLWRADATSPTREPLILSARLPGPHVAAAFAPPSLASVRNQDGVVAVFGIDAINGALHLYSYSVTAQQRTSSSVQSVGVVTKLVTCSVGNNTGSSLRCLVSVPLLYCGDRSTSGQQCFVFGVAVNGRVCCWHVSRARKASDAQFEPVVMRFTGRRFGHVTAADATEEAGSSRQLIAVGSADGCVRVYELVEEEDAGSFDNAVCDNGGNDEDPAAPMHTANFECQFADEDNAAPRDGSEGVVRLREVAFLGEKDRSEAGVRHVAIMAGGERIAMMREDGSMVLWERSSAVGTSWRIALSLPPPELPEDSCDTEQSTGGLSFGRGCNGQLVLFAARAGGTTELFHKPQGTNWERSVVFSSVGHGNAGPMAHIGLGIVVVGRKRGILALDGSAVTISNNRVIRAAGYSPARGLFAHLLSGGRAWQTIAALEELSEYVESSADRIFTTSATASGCFLAPPPPPLSIMLSRSDSAPAAVAQRNDSFSTIARPTSVPERSDKSSADWGMGGLSSMSGKGDLFTQLMAKSEEKITADELESTVVRTTNVGQEGSLDPSLASDSKLLKLGKRLRILSLTSFSPTEQNVLSALCIAASSLKGIMRFALVAACFLEVSPTLPVPYAAVASALHSTAADALSAHFLRPNPVVGNIRRQSVKVGQRLDDAQPLESLWVLARRLGAGWWLASQSGAKGLVEHIARAEFNTTRDADCAALWYVALGRVKALAALYKAQLNLRMSAFLNRNFREESNRIAAGKNAYVLVSKHRLHLAAMFFIVSGDIRGALNLVRTRLKDEQLAILLARVLDGGKQVGDVLEGILEAEDVLEDPHRRGMTLWLLGRHHDALAAVNESTHQETQGIKSDLERALGAGLTPASLALGHLTALSDRPPIRNTPAIVRAIGEGRERAMYALTADGSSISALRVGCDMLFDINAASGVTSATATARKSAIVDSGTNDAISRFMEKEQIQPAKQTELLRPIGARPAPIVAHVVSIATDAMRERALAASESIRSGASKRSLLSLTEMDLHELGYGPLGVECSVQVACAAAADLSRADEIDSSISLAYGALKLATNSESENDTTVLFARAQVEDCCFLASARCITRSLCALSPLHRPNTSLAELNALCTKATSAAKMLRKVESRLIIASSEQLMDTLKRATLALSMSAAYLAGDWAALLAVLRSCEYPPASLRIPSSSGLALDKEEGNEEDDDMFSRRSTCSSLAPESISLEGLRHVASNPAVLGIAPRIGHRRRNRRAPSLALVDVDGASAAALTDEQPAGSPALGAFSTEALDTIRAHPALNSALGSAAISYLASHQASRAADMVARHASRDICGNSLVPSVGGESVRSVINLARLLESSEAFEHVAADAIARWIPLMRFGSCREISGLAVGGTGQSEESAGAFVDLWCALGCLPEYAPALSEAATVAAAEVAAAAAQRAMAEEDVDSRVNRRRRRNMVAAAVSGSMAKQSSAEIFDTTSADSLYGAYPVRFSASAKGPWSGKGGFACLYEEKRALFRTLCISSSDPPAVIVATPRGLQEVVPSSYTAMPAGFRSHYFARKRNRDSCGARAALFRPRDDMMKDSDHRGAVNDDSISGDIDDLDLDFQNETYDGAGAKALAEDFDSTLGEGSYMRLDMSNSSTGIGDDSSSHSSGSYILRASYSAVSSRRKLIWRHQVEATALAAHPLRRRFASGGTDGVVRLWDFGDPVALGALQHRNFGRVAALKYSAYGNALVSVHACGNVALWHDPDIYVGMSTASGRGRSEPVIRAFQGRNASDAVFLDEQFTIAAVGDPLSTPAMGHSLRIFDTREPHSSMSPSWSARVHNGGEARCVALLEDRVRVVTGGLDGWLSVVDLRMSKSATAGGGGMQARVAELPAHDDEVTCLGTELPRGRALVSGCRNGDIKIWDSRTLLQLDSIPGAHPPTRHYWSGSGIGGLVGSYGVQSVVLTDRSLISCGGDGKLKAWGPGHSTAYLNVV
jgi:WD40 repeat protein